MGHIKRTETRQDEKTEEHHLLRNDGSLLSGLQRNALASLVHFVVTVQRRVVQLKPPAAPPTNNNLMVTIITTGLI